jgi:hypothetical protein
MTKRAMNNQRSKSGSGYGDNATFADVSLSQSDKDAFSKWMSDALPDIEIWLAALTDDSYRLSLKFDYHNNCYSAALTQQDNKHHNSGLVIMSRASTAVEAVLMSAYKVFVLFDGEALPTRNADNNWG